MKVWQETEFTNHLYYDDSDGRIIGITHKLGTQSIIYIAKVYKDNIEAVLGQYVSCEYAKIAIENFWLVEEKTYLT